MFRNNDLLGCDYFDAIRIGIASPEKIKQSAFGEVTKPETINYRTFKPEKDGLFCAKIFGPVKDYECMCGKYKRNREDRGNVCDKCGVEITLSKVRRERMGYIDLASPVAHIWFYKALPSYIATLLNFQSKEVERIISFDSYVVIDPGMSSFQQHQLISEAGYANAKAEYGADSFVAMTGAEAIYTILENLDLVELRDEIREQLRNNKFSDIQRRKVIRRLRVAEGFINSGNSPKWMVLKVLPVIPPDLRPLVHLDGGRFATSDLNDLYRRVINRNNRLRILISLRAPDLIVKNEKRMLQESVDALIDNARKPNKIVKGMSKRPFKSLSDMIKGKQGRFRQNLLGKRVDYSGRSVIVVGATLKLHQCGLPKYMALELFKPFVYNKLQLHGKANTVKAAKRMVSSQKPEVWDYLEEVIKNHPVLLNRAPTLHRLGIQAFEPVLIEGKAIQLHPLVCSAFNADFDGDQMAVHVPLSMEAQMEARVLMLSVNNILSPSNGKPIITPSEDIVLGIYYLSLENTDEEEAEDDSGDVFNPEEVELALMDKRFSLHTKVKCRIKYYDDEEQEQFKIISITPGRLILFNILPKHPKLPLSLVNRTLTKKMMGDVVNKIYYFAGQNATIDFCQNLMKLGFKYATVSGVSFGKDDMVIPETKQSHLDAGKKEVQEYESRYQEGLITSREKYNKVIDVWSRCTENVADDMMTAMSLPNGEGKGINVIKDANSVYMMAHSGARGSAAQMKQLAGMRGLMSRPSGDIIENPIMSNFREGLNVTEYFISTHGARKGLADTALKTANSGYLTRRLVDVSQDCVVVEEDCGTDEGIKIESIPSIGVVISDIDNILLGRFLAKDIVDPSTAEVLIKANTLIDNSNIDIIRKVGVSKVHIRSILTCKSKNNGVCVKCYGKDLTTGDMVSIGDAVGVIAAQSVGEPGTQLTMRTFHIGGAVSKSSESSSIEAPMDCTVKFVDAKMAINSSGTLVTMNRISEMLLLDSDGNEQGKYRLQYGANVYVKDGDSVKSGLRLADWDLHTLPIITEQSGTVNFADIVENVSMEDVLDEETGMSTKIIVDWKQKAKIKDCHPMIKVVDEDGNVKKTSSGLSRYFLPVGAILSVEDGDTVSAGDIVARIPREKKNARDITGGLPRVVELFEARVSKDSAVINEIDGVVEFCGDDTRSRRKITINPDNDGEPVQFAVPKGKHLTVMEGDYVKKGDLLMDGDPNPHDILRVLGVNMLYIYMIFEILKVYNLQNVHIDTKHIEVIVCQMLRKLEVLNPGDSEYCVGEEMDRNDFIAENERLIAEGKEPINARPILQGITKASLDTKSFISAASFQDTTRVLTQAAIEGKVDNLIGLKENVIMGRLLPVGTGYMVRKWKKEGKELAADNDETEGNESMFSNESTDVSGFGIGEGM